MPPYCKQNSGLRRSWSNASANSSKNDDQALSELREEMQYLVAKNQSLSVDVQILRQGFQDLQKDIQSLQRTLQTNLELHFDQQAATQKQHAAHQTQQMNCLLGQMKQLLQLQLKAEVGTTRTTPLICTSEATEQPTSTFLEAVAEGEEVEDLHAELEMPQPHAIRQLLDPGKDMVKTKGKCSFIEPEVPVACDRAEAAGIPSTEEPTSASHSRGSNDSCNYASIHVPVGAVDDVSALSQSRATLVGGSSACLPSVHVCKAPMEDVSALSQNSYICSRSSHASVEKTSVTDQKDPYADDLSIDIVGVFGIAAAPEENEVEQAPSPEDCPVPHHARRASTQHNIPRSAGRRGSTQHNMPPRTGRRQSLQHNMPPRTSEQQSSQINTPPQVEQQASKHQNLPPRTSRRGSLQHNLPRRTGRRGSLQLNSIPPRIGLRQSACQGYAPSAPEQVNDGNHILAAKKSMNSGDGPKETPSLKSATPVFTRPYRGRAKEPDNNGSCSSLPRDSFHTNPLVRKHRGRRLTMLMESECTDPEMSDSDDQEWDSSDESFGLTDAKEEHNGTKVSKASRPSNKSNTSCSETATKATHEGMEMNETNEVTSHGSSPTAQELGYGVGKPDGNGSNADELERSGSFPTAEELGYGEY